MVNVGFGSEPTRSGSIPRISYWRIAIGETFATSSAAREGPTFEGLDGVDLDLPMPEMPTWVAIPRAGMTQVCREYEEKEILKCFGVFDLLESSLQVINGAGCEGINMFEFG